MSSDVRSAKQVIVMRTDLNMRKGKMVAQGGHAAIGSLRDAWSHGLYADCADFWFQTGATKVCVGVSSETELMAVYARAKADNLPAYLVTDAGHTEFHGVPTRTCLAIGPAWTDEIDAITGSLRLL